jgi:hypothetical protein
MRTQELKNKVKKPSLSTGFGNAKIRDTQASTNKKNGINAILTLCLSWLMP